MILEQQKFETEYLPPKLGEHAQRIIESGALYIHGRDQCHRPYLVMSA